MQTCKSCAIKLCRVIQAAPATITSRSDISLVNLLSFVMHSLASSSLGSELCAHLLQDAQIDKFLISQRITGHPFFSFFFFTVVLQKVRDIEGFVGT